MTSQLAYLSIPASDFIFLSREELLAINVQTFIFQRTKTLRSEQSSEIISNIVLGSLLPHRLNCLTEVVIVCNWMLFG
jgi:hypothetical protein